MTEVLSDAPRDHMIVSRSSSLEGRRIRLAFAAFGPGSSCLRGFGWSLATRHRRAVCRGVVSIVRLVLVGALRAAALP